MSFEDDLKRLGNDVADLVDNAVSSQNFQELNRKINDTINQFVYPNKSNRTPDGPYQQQERHFRMQQRSHSSYTYRHTDRHSSYGGSGQRQTFSSYSNPGQEQSPYFDGSSGQGGQSSYSNGSSGQGQSSYSYGNNGQQQSSYSYGNNGQGQSSYSYGNNGQQQSSYSYGSSGQGQPSYSYGSSGRKQPVSSYGQRNLRQPQQNRWQPPSSDTRRRHLFASSTNLAFLSNFQITAGVAATLLVMILVLFLKGSFTFNSFLLLLLTCSPLAAGGIYLLLKGNSNGNLCKTFRTAQKLIGQKDYITIEDLSSGLHLSKEDTLKKVHKMLNKKLFRQGHLDKQETCLMITDTMYDQYLQMEQEYMHRQREEENRLQQEAAEKERQQKQELERDKELEKSGLTEEQRKMIRECEEYLQKIHQCGLDLSGAVIADKINRLELIVSRILQTVRRQPSLASELQKFMNYYMPTTWKLLDSYRSFEQEPIQSENITKTKKEIEDTLDTINTAFETLLNDMFQSTAWDISSDISVLESMLAQEGLTGNRMKPQ